MKRTAPPADDTQRRLAVLIDADNASPAVIEGLLDEVAKYGVASVKRIYGDFTNNRANGWKAALLKHSIQPVQQFAYTSGKNATDSALIIDAMDLLYTKQFDGFCLVSSDSDFTRLAQRLRESGITVYGFGEQKTPDPFVQACDKFVYTEVLRAAPEPAVAPAKKAARKEAKDTTPASPDTASTAAAKPGAAKPEAGKPSGRKGALDAATVQLILRAIDEANDDEEWAHLGAVGSYLTKIRPNFDSRLYGCKKLSDLLRAHPQHFTVENRPSSSGSGQQPFVRAAG
ncbi:NYN domain-containing protein [Cognatilysobacter bugurensis]|uniref:HTH OST-type domain-containing protein n=1 Tax=Cognatilysobacter bugurensis TaxID=543356 RepID=A0A918W750_9GAMM|nr:NYN domain-containing protein [Lysobacter bugurensis]GHA80400.1 hypothetical protein GCM10007067_17700 [Lysobacter bugurensis]